MDDTNDVDVVVDVEENIDTQNEIDYKAEAAKYKRMASQYRSKFLKATETKVEAPKEQKPEQTDFDYSQKAFLLAKGIGDEDFSLVLEEAKKFGSDLSKVKLEDLIGNPYFQQKLEATRTTRANELAAETGNGRGNNGVSSKNTPEYWLNKLGPNDQIPSDLPRDLREKIVDARRKAGSTAKMFYND